MSLQRIALKDFVIVDRLALEFGAGFTALTGETGAGKSILIDALQLALGGRADPSAIRDGQDKAEVTVEFAATPPSTDWLSEAGIDAEGESVLVRRTLDAQGRSRGWINGTPVTATQLRELGARLVDIHGQHAWQGLMKPETNRELLDAYGGIDTQPMQRAWADWQTAVARLAQAEQAALAGEAEREQLTWHLRECDRLAPEPQEWPRLQEEHTRLAHTAALGESAQTALDRLCDADVNAVSLLTRAQQALAQRMHQDTRFKTMGETLEQALLLAQEAARDLQAYVRHAEADPGRLGELEQRLSQWMALAKRHRCPPEELPQVRTALQQRLEALAHATDLRHLREETSRLEKAYFSLSRQVSALRQGCQTKFEAEVTHAIRQLGMAGGTFQAHIEPLAHPQAMGADFVEFRVASHAGAVAKPVLKVASGGELSRLALAISVTTSQLGGCPTLIFDEVDSGIGGTVAHTVGRLMATLGQKRQVLAVTHLAQVACCAHHHVQVSKQWDERGLQSRAEPLTADQRVAEVARMLGGDGQSETPFAHAREMLGYD
jgi:DNA repair protein RecN (Recombination protein N)